MVFNDPYKSYSFLVVIEGLIVAGFSEVSGLQAEIEVEEIREGSVNDYVHKLPKVTKYPNLSLKRGITDSDNLWDWHHSAVKGKIEKKNVFLILNAREQIERLQQDPLSKLWGWVFFDAYPVKWVGPDLKADSSTVAIETLELAHNGMQRV